MFIADGARPVVMRPTERFMTMSRFLLIGLEPVGAFPAELFAERTAQVAQTIIGGGEPKIAARETLLTGKMDVVILGISFDRARRGIILAVVVGAEASHIQSPHVPLRMTIDDPFCHHLADATCAR